VDTVATNPFTDALNVPVRGGELYIARSGPPPEEAGTVVVAVHGITASHLNWRTVARELAGVSMLAPDLRGRGASNRLGPPYGIAAHVEDLLAVLDTIPGHRAVLAGHSMGAYIVARLAAEHPGRASAVVLVDGGLPVTMPAGTDPDAVLAATLGPAMARLEMTFASTEDYVAFFARHPAFEGRWDDDIEAYVRYDLEGEPGALRSRVCAEAVRADGTDILLDAVTREAALRVGAPLTLLRARRGLLDDDNPLIPRETLRAFADARPQSTIYDLPEVNHYTIALGHCGAAGLVASAIARQSAKDRP
jgi:pimeloyl-ACP methyl ester carboxylesterase